MLPQSHGTHKYIVFFGNSAKLSKQLQNRFSCPECPKRPTQIHKNCSSLEGNKFALSWTCIWSGRHQRHVKKHKEMCSRCYCVNKWSPDPKNKMLLDQFKGEPIYFSNCRKLQTVSMCPTCYWILSKHQHYKNSRSAQIYFTNMYPNWSGVYFRSDSTQLAPV